jgi:hypothetical protein
MYYNGHRGYVETIDFGSVPIRRNYTGGDSIGFIELSADPKKPNEVYADIRADLRTNQPFAVILDAELNEVK